MIIKRFVLVMITVVAIMTFSWILLAVNDARSASDGGDASCTVCHKGVGKDLPSDHPAIEDPEPQNIEAIRKIFDARAGSRFLDGIHAKNEVSCRDCHGETMPEMETTVETDSCLGCHDSYENLAKLTVNEECAEKNPHKSHLGEVDCTVCHKGHAPSQAYCLQCHSNFVIPMPGDGKDVKGQSSTVK